MNRQFDGSSLEKRPMYASPSKQLRLAKGVSLRPSEADDKLMRRFKLWLAKYMVTIPSPRELEDRIKGKRPVQMSSSLPFVPRAGSVDELGKEDEHIAQDSQDEHPGEEQSPGLPSVREILDEVQQQQVPKIQERLPAAGKLAKFGTPLSTLQQKTKKMPVNWRVEPLTALKYLLRDDVLVAKLQGEVDRLAMLVYRLYKDTKLLLS